MSYSLIQSLVPESKYSLKCPNAMAPVGICVHNTANDAAAKNEISYMTSRPESTSFHFAVDDVSVVQGLPLDRNGWHAGDGNGDGNRKHIGIEICYSKSGGDKFTKAEENAAELIAKLLKERGWGIDRVRKHQDFSGKYCPHRTLDLGWGRFLKMIESKMGGNMSANYYPKTGDFKIDKNNEKSVEAAIDAWVKVASGQTVDKTAHEAQVADAQKTGYSKGKFDLMSLVTREFGLPSDTDTPEKLIDGLKNLINQSNNGSGQNSTTVIDLPKSVTLKDGSRWNRNGVQLDTTGKAVANYEEQK